jgi:hypothetical protein
MNDIYAFAWQFFRNNIQYIILLTAPFILLASPSYFVVQPPDNRIGYMTYIGLAVYLTGFSMYMSSLIFFMSQKYGGDLQSVKTNLINGLVYSPLLILTLLLANSPLIAAIVILYTSVSLQFLALPLIILGIYVSLRATFAPFHLILEGYKPVGAIICSFSSTKGRVAKIVMILLVFYITTSFVEAASTFTSKVELFNLFMFFFGLALTLLMMALQQIAIFKIYIDSFDE